MFLGTFDLRETGNYRQVDLPDHALCALCLERKATYAALYQLGDSSIHHAKKLCWPCLVNKFLGKGKPTGGDAA